MQRRDWLKLLSMPAGLALANSITSTAMAQNNALYQGKVLVSIYCHGGIDQSSWADPREDGKVNIWARNKLSAGVAGRIRYAPMGDNTKLFQKYYKQMLVVNGLHADSNNHVTAFRIMNRGRSNSSWPQLADLFAARYGSGLPFPLIQDEAFPSHSLAKSSTPPSINELGLMTNPNNSIFDSRRTFLRDADVAAMRSVRQERLQALQARSDNLPRMREALAEYADTLKIKGLLTTVPKVDQFDSRFGDVHSGLIAVRAGLTSSLQFIWSNFDAHSELMVKYNRLLPGLAAQIDFLWEKARELGVEQRLFVRIFSEFGRTPWINGGNGKDHWAVGTDILMEANPVWGNRTFGISGPLHEQVPINPATGAASPRDGVSMRPRHLHQAIRDYLKIDNISEEFDLNVPANERLVGLFDPAAHSGYPNL